MSSYPEQYEAALRQGPAPHATHRWIMSTANLAVFAGRPPQEAVAEITAALPRRPEPADEVEVAVNKAFADHPDWKLSTGKTVSATHGTPVGKARPADREAAPPAPDAFAALVADREAAPPAPDAFAALVAGGADASQGWWTANSAVPIPPRPDLEYAALLRCCYAMSEMVCAGDKFAVAPRSVEDILGGQAHGEKSPEYICANPLTGRVGETKSGGKSTRCDATVAAYRYVVAEMDEAPLDDQARFWAGWRRNVPGIPIAALIYTGGKSLHAWLRVDAADAGEWQRLVRDRLFPAVLTPLGCDRTCKNASRLTRAPGHWREEKEDFQRLLFLDPAARRSIPLDAAVEQAADWVKAHRNAPHAEPDPAAAGGATPQPPARGRKSDKEKALPLALQFLERETILDRPRWLHHREIWLYWQAGAWSDTNGEGELFAEVMAWLQARQGEKATHGLARAIMQQMASASLCHLPARFAMPCWLPGGEDAKGWLCMGDDLVDVQGLASGAPLDECVQPATPALFSRWQVGYKFDPDAKCPHFEKYLDDVFPDKDDRRMALYAMACVLGNLKHYEVFFFCYGDGGTGKTIFTAVLKALVGAKNASSLDLMDLDEKHAQHVLCDSMLNVTSELPANINRADLGRIEATIKRVVSGEDIKVEHKGLEPYFAAAMAILVFASNYMPSWVDRTNGLRRRQRCIPFLHNQSERPDVDRDLLPKLLGELPGIFNLAIEAMRDLIANHPNAFPELGNGARLLAEHMRETDIERTFLEEAYEVAPGEQTVTGRAIYDAYKTYCEDNGYRAKGANLFAADIRRVFPGASKERLSLDAARSVYWVGLHKKVYIEPDDVEF